MKILHVNMSLDTVSGGGTVERVLQLHKALLKAGVESHILTINNPDNEQDNFSDSKVTKLPSINKRWFIPFPKLAIVNKLVEEADVIHLMNYWTLINIWVYLVARKLGKPYIICPAGALTVYGRSTIIKYLYQQLVGKKILKNASMVIAISPLEVDLFENHGVESKKIYQLPNGVNDDDFKYSDSALFRNTSGIGSAPYILFVGRLNAIKGPDILLHAFEKYYKVIPHHLVFAGPDGGMTEQLKQQVLDLNLIDRVHFTGYLGGNVKSSAYHGAELLVVPSRHEAMSIVALEAAISSTPVLLTDQCGFSSLADVGAAIEVSATIDGLSKGLEEMIVDNDQLEKMGSCGRKFAIEYYTWDIMAERFIALSNLIQE